MGDLGYESFVNNFTNALNDAAFKRGLDVEVNTTVQAKTNELVDTITLRFENSSICPSVPLRGEYESFKEANKSTGISIWEYGAKELDRFYEAHKSFPSHGFDPADVNYDYVREHLFFKLMNRSMNEEICKTSPTVTFCNDLVKVPYVHVYQNGDEEASFRLTNDLRESIRMTEEEVFKFAQFNEKDENFICKSFCELFPFIPEEENTFYILTTEDKSWGAVAMTSPKALEMASERIGTDKFFIIPSSIHELILVRQDQVDDPADLQVICKDVNNNPDVIDRSEVLSSTIYRYNGSTVQICNSLNDLKQQLLNESKEETEANHITRRM